MCEQLPRRMKIILEDLGLQGQKGIKDQGSNAQRSDERAYLPQPWAEPAVLYHRGKVEKLKRLATGDLPKYNKYTHHERIPQRSRAYQHFARICIRAQHSPPPPPMVSKRQKARHLVAPATIYPPNFVNNPESGIGLANSGTSDEEENCAQLFPTLRKVSIGKMLCNLQPP